MDQNSIQATEIVLVDQERREAWLGRRLTDPMVGKIIGYGGRVEAGEKPVRCIIRETYEEAKVVVLPEDLRHIGMLRTFRKFGTFNIHLYMATKWQGVPKRTRTMTPVQIALHGPYPEEVPEEMQHILRAITLEKYRIRITVYDPGHGTPQVDATY